MRTTARLALALLAGLIVLADAPARAQSTGFVTGFPGKDPAGDDEIGWGPAYRPETSFSQPGTPPTPGDFAGAAYRARTGRGPYDAVQAGDDRPAGYALAARAHPVLGNRHARSRVAGRRPPARARRAR